MNRQPAPFESLESRTLMSVSVFDAAVKADRAHITADFVQLRSDLLADSKNLLTDNKALRQDKLHANTVLQPLVVKLRSDVKTFDLTLKSDRLTEAGNVIADEKVIVHELVQIIKDRKNATALAGDKTALTADRVQLQTDEVAGLDQRLTDRGAEVMTLATDTQNILTALPTSGASAKLTADVNAWLSTKTANVERITADLTKIMTDRSQLITDLGND